MLNVTSNQLELITLISVGVSVFFLIIIIIQAFSNRKLDKENDGLLDQLEKKEVKELAEKEQTKSSVQMTEEQLEDITNRVILKIKEKQQRGAL